MAALAIEPGLRDRIGGRWAVSWVTFVVLSLLGFVGVALNDFASPVEWLLASTCAAAALGLVLLLAHVTVLRHRATRPVPVWLVVVVGAVAGAVRGVVLVLAIEGIGASTLRPWPVFVLAGAFSGALGTVGIALLMDMLSRQRDQRDALRARLVALREQDLERSGLADVMTTAVYAEVATALDDARRQLDVPVGEVDVDDRLAVAERLRDTVDRTLRPLSHRLYAAGQREPQPVPRPRLRPASLASLPLMPVAAGIVVSIFAISVSAYPVGGLAIGAMAFVAMFAASRAARRWQWVRLRQLIIGAVAVFAVGALSIVLVRAVADAPQAWFTTIVPAVVMAAFTVLVSAVGAVLDGTSHRMRGLEEQVVAREVDAHVANREIARASREVAQHVHGVLQSHLLATAFAIEQAADRDDDAAFRRALAGARTALEDDAMPRVPARALAVELDDIAALWRGFVDVRIAIDDDVPALPAPRVADIARIVGEAVANARKHGLARRAEVSITRTTDGVCVMVVDDGTGPQDGVPGMGSAWLEFILPGRWSLAVGPGGAGTCLQVLLPVESGVDAAVAPPR